MQMIMKKLIRTSLVVLMLSSSASLAQDFDKGLAAYESGDFATALEEWRPLAEQGDATAQSSVCHQCSRCSGRSLPYLMTTTTRWYVKHPKENTMSNIPFARDEIVKIGKRIRLLTDDQKRLCEELLKKTEEIASLQDELLKIEKRHMHKDTSFMDYRIAER